MQKTTYKLEEHIGVLSKSSNGWEKSLNIVSWNGRPANFDLRSWNFENDFPIGKGIVLTKEELLKLGDIIQNLKKDGVLNDR